MPNEQEITQVAEITEDEDESFEEKSVYYDMDDTDEADADTPFEMNYIRTEVILGEK